MQQKLLPLHLACGFDETNPNTMLIGIKKNIATASNGTLLVKLDLTQTSHLGTEDLALLDGKFIHRETWKDIHKCDELTINEKSIDCEKNGIKKTFYYEKSNGEFWENDVVQEVKDMGEEKKRIICYSPSQIDTIHKIFQVDMLNFSFSAKNRGTVIFPSSDSGMFAILMPLEQTELNRYLFLD